MRSPDLLPAILDSIVVGGPDGLVSLRQLLKIASNDGLSLEELELTSNLIYDSNIAASSKNTLISECLIPRGDYLLPSGMVSRILAAVGAPEVYYKNGKQHKLKRLAVACQQRLLQWLISMLPFFGRDAFRILKRQIPILFGLLSYEFSRPYICSLIVLATSGPDAIPKLPAAPLIRPWHVQLVLDLYHQFPQDSSLKSLLAYFKMRNLTLKLQLKVPGLSSADASGISGYPNPLLNAESLAKFESLPLFSEVNEVNSQITRLFESLDSPLSKKRKILGPSFDLVSSSKPTSVLILAINSVSSLVSQLENINLTNPSSVLRISTGGGNKFRALYLALHLLVATDNDQTLKKLEYAMRYHIFDDGEHNSLLVFSQLLEFARYQGLLRLIEPSVQYINSDPRSGVPLHLKKLIRLLRYLPWEKSVIVSAVSRIIEQLESSKANELNELTNSFFLEIAFLIAKSNLSSQLTDTSSEFLSGLLEILLRLYGFAEEKWRIFSLGTKLKFLSVLKAVKAIPTDIPWSAAGQLVPPPTLMYQLFVSTNPLVVSEAMGFIAFLKKISLPDGETRALALRNAYVMDSINFVWQELALKKEPATFSQGMLLDDEFLQRVGALNFFSYSSIIQLKTVGGLIQNPSWLYICAELVWMLEDKAEGITTRHPGPISEDSVAQARQDPDNVWLSMSYYDIKISLINSLDQLGYSGLCDLLFSSLKSLANKRSHSG